MHTYTKVSFATAQPLILAAVKANANTLLIGPPGVGKTALMGQIAREIDLPLITLIGSTLDGVLVGGFPIVDAAGNLTRRVMQVLQRACDEPCLLFLDEVSTAPPPVQAAFLRILHDRVVGDTPLHPGTRIVAACNPPEMSPNGFELTAPFVGRFAIWDFEPTLDEVRKFFAALGNETDDERLSTVALEWVATSEAEPRLIQIQPPAAALQTGAKWASPRDVERALRLEAALPADVSPDIQWAAWAGCVGEDAAQTYLAIRKLRGKLPTVSEVASDPLTALVPEHQYQIGALGLLANVATRDLWAAWAYAARLDEEIASAAGRALMRRKQPAKQPEKWTKLGGQARARYGSLINKMKEVV